MIIHNLKLENIRSYLNQEINFPQGSILLAGDIGTGKSSVLLAIEFALFGFMKGYVSGNSLLRHGKNKGSVELKFNVDNKDVIIKRILKRSSNTVSQDSGYIVINGHRKDLSPIELKQEVLQLLNYPQELLTKSKAFVFRYTVYTPQEEMKKILLEEKEIRLDTLRRVFNIDKYKNIKENSKIFISKIKEKNKELSARIEDLQEKLDEKREYESSIEKLNKEIELIKPGLEKVRNEIKIKKTIIKETEDKIKIHHEIKRHYEVIENELKNKNDLINKITKEILELQEEIKNIGDSLKNIEIKDYRNLIIDTEDKLKNLENVYLDLNSKIAVSNSKKNISEELKKKISELNVCPICKQVVSNEHKHNIILDEDKKINEVKKEYENNLKKLNLMEVGLKEAKKELEDLRKKQSEVELIKLKQENLNEKKQRLENLHKNKQELNEHIEINNKNKLNLIKEISKNKDLDFAYEMEKELLEKIQEREKELDIKKATITKEIEDNNKGILDLNEEIEKKLKVKNQLENISEINFWLDEHFINLVSTIEKQIMLKVYSDFSLLFQRWFNELVNDENLNIKLDYDFSPLIIQNGYETDYDFLSGGEKTGAALAYRLSLNQVINNLMSNLKTSDLLILDEPTDGFSSEQLDRLRNVLNQLKIKQVIIVSHEPKIESFVDNIIRFNKVNHITEVNY